MNAEMSVDEDVFFTLQERPLHKTLQDKMQLRADVMSWFCRGAQKGSLDGNERLQIDAASRVVPRKIPPLQSQLGL